MQHDMHFAQGSGGCLQANYLLSYCCIRDSIKFDMQHGLVLNDLNFELLTPRVERWEGQRAQYLLLCCCIRDSI